MHVSPCPVLFRCKAGRSARVCFPSVSSSEGKAIGEWRQAEAVSCHSRLSSLTAPRLIPSHRISLDLTLILPTIRRLLLLHTHPHAGTTAAAATAALARRAGTGTAGGATTAATVTTAAAPGAAGLAAETGRPPAGAAAATGASRACFFVGVFRCSMLFE